MQEVVSTTARKRRNPLKGVMWNGAECYITLAMVLEGFFSAPPTLLRFQHLIKGVRN